MAAGWSKTNVSQNIEYSHKWEIQNFDLAMVVGGGKIESDRFCIPGVPEEFYMELKNKTECTSYGYEMKLGDQEFHAKFYFSVALKSTESKGTKAAGKLEVIKEGAKTLTGKFGDAASHSFQLVKYRDFSPNCGLTYYDGMGFQKASGFFTTGSTCLLNLVATITIPGKLSSLGGTAAEEEMKQNRLLDFQPFLSDPKHSDIVLKCGDTRFQCHKVILAARSVVFERMLDQNMEEARTGEVDILDVDPGTLKQMLEFIYTGQVEDENYTAELLYAADKYELNDLVKLCARQFRSEVNPDTAADILLLADRHSLAQLKQEVMMKVVAEKARYLASPEFNSQMKKNPALLMELFSM